MEERVSGAEDNIENKVKTVRENAKMKKLLTQNVKETQDTRRISHLQIIEIEEGKEYQLRGTVNIFNKIIEENVPNLRNEITMSIKEAYRTPNTMDQKRNFSRHIIVKTQSTQSKERILKAVREKGHVNIKADQSESNLTSQQRL